MRKDFLITFCLLSIAGVVGFLFDLQFIRQQVSAQESKSLTLIPQKQSETDSGKNADRLNKFNELIEKSEMSGSIKVIAALRTDFIPEGELSLIHKREQRAEIKRLQAALLGKLRNSAIDDVKQFDFIPYMAFKADAAALKELKNAPEIVSIQEDKLVAPTLAESTVIVGSPGGVSNSFSGDGQAVAVLDTGVDKSHVFFPAGKIISEACYSTTNANDGATSVCPGGAPSSTAPDSGLNCSASVRNCDHGTHVAGIVAGKDTASNRFGVAKEAKIIAIQIFSAVSNPTYCGSTPCALSYTSDIIAGLQRVSELSDTISIAAANLSLGGDSFASYCDNIDASAAATKAAIDNLRSKGIATVIASGNGGNTTGVSFPGCISTAVSVGSTTDGSNGGAVDTVSGFSNSANFLNLLAPGSLIYSSIPGANPYWTFSGTSMAAPHVAGAWAILKQQKSNATVSEVLTALTSTGKIITDTRNGAGNRQTPRIRIDAASRQIALTDCVRAPMNINQTVNPSLDAGDCALESGVNRDLFAFNGAAGTNITVSMSSSDFNSYLYLLDPNGKIIASDDDSGGGTSARIPSSGTFSLPLSGSYTVIATKSAASLRLESPQNGTYVLNIGSPTAAAASVSGQVELPSEIGLINALVTLTDSQGNAQTILTGKGGRFRFRDVRVGETYILSVRSRRYTFAPQVITVNGDMTDLNFTAVQ